MNRKLINKGALFCICILFPFYMNAQQKPLTSQYILNPLIINPSTAGNSGALNVATFYRQQWVGVEGAPNTLSLSVDAPFTGQRLGLGLMIVNDRIGVSRETSFNTSYAFKINLKKGILSLGLGAGLMATNTIWSDLIALDPGDDVFLVDSRVFVVPDFSYGMYYTSGNYFAGFSIPRLIGYDFDFSKNKYALSSKPGEYDHMFNTGYSFDLGEKTRFFPSLLLSFSPHEKLLYDINSHFIFYDRFWFGVSYRNNRSLTGLFQLNVNNQFKIAYSYDFDIGNLSRYSLGTHELMLRYLFRYKVETVNPLIF